MSPTAVAIVESTRSRADSKITVGLSTNDGQTAAIESKANDTDERYLLNEKFINEVLNTGIGKDTHYFDEESTSSASSLVGSSEQSSSSSVYLADAGAGDFISVDVDSIVVHAT